MICLEEEIGGDLFGGVTRVMHKFFGLSANEHGCC